MLQKLVLSYFHNVIHLLSQLTDNDTLQMAVTESAKIIPYIVSSRKTVKLYLKVSLRLHPQYEIYAQIDFFFLFLRNAWNSGRVRTTAFA